MTVNILILPWVEDLTDFACFFLVRILHWWFLFYSFLQVSIRKKNDARLTCMWTRIELNCIFWQFDSLTIDKIVTGSWRTPSYCLLSLFENIYRDLDNFFDIIRWMIFGCAGFIQNDIIQLLYNKEREWERDRDTEKQI